MIPSSLPTYSCQRDSGIQSSSSESSSFNHDWDRMMTEIEEVSEIIVDFDVIAADLQAELHMAPSEGGNIMQGPTHTHTQEDVSLLKTPHSSAVADVYDGVSVLESSCTESPDPLDLLSYTTFAATCSTTWAPTVSSHHLDCMAFVVTVMNGTSLIASGQQLCSADSILLEPLSLSKAKTCNNWHKWQEAMVSEMASMNKMNVFELADIPADGKLIGICWIPPPFKTKETKGKCCRLKKALYGLKQARCLWHVALDEQLQAFSFKCCQAEPCMYTHSSSDAMVLLVVYLNDLLIIRAITSRVQLVQQQLSSVFNITDQGSVSHIIGLNMQYSQEAHTLSNNQSRYIEGVLAKFGMDKVWAASTPATETINTFRPQEDDTASAEEVCHYTSFVGSLLWITQGSRPDITFAVGCCTCFAANPSGEHLVSAKCILRYLKGTVGVSLSAKTPSGGQILTGWANSDWVGLHNCRRSTSGYVFTIDGLVCSWSSQLQLTVANSSVKEAEYVALTVATKELLWASMFLCELKQPVPKTAEIHVSTGTLIIHSHSGELAFDQNIPILHSNSSGACAIASDPQHFKRTKHIDITDFFLRDKIASRQLTITPVQSSENLADILTKPLAAPTILHLQQLLGMVVSMEHTGSRGGTEGNDPI
ncbi:uncharacterized protein UBRO_20981 [Ustilago bromivora]|uniref:Reverse transcriptase Ty1/copia-type domain-containing protein n=1 Tax=Ustilago bromivora TaxID=307758 RepID=A0A1K0GEB8_9BASI|nr:uncharacterized protein UBRO_20981 [Ustilago bromivora]